MEDQPSDYRASRMPTAEGRGQAKDAVDRLLDKNPDWAERIPFARQFGVKSSMSLLGFWLVWQSAGGFAGLRKLGMPETTIWRYVKNFREGFGVHPDEYTVDGIDLAVVRENWLRGGGPRALHTREDLKERDK